MVKNYDEISNSLGRCIKTRRKELGINADTLAEKVGIGRSTAFKYESGMIKDIKATTLMKIADVLNTSPNELLGWENDKTA